MNPSQIKTLATGIAIGATAERIRGAIKFSKMVKNGSVILLPRHIQESIKAGYDLVLFVRPN